MNTETTPVSVDEIQVEIARCVPSPANKARALDAAFLASIQAEGVLQPVLLRYHPAGEDYEIVCGHRRVAACKELGLDTVPAVIREMSDDQVRRAILVENRDREDLTPWQEAQHVKEYLEDGFDLAAIAAALSMSPSQVKRRARLLDLTPAWREAIDGGEYKHWTTNMLELIAGLEPAMQDAVREGIHDWDDSWKLADIERHLSNMAQVLKAAPWDLDDATLDADVGACTGCPNRSDAQEDLFGDVDALVKGGARCLNAGCFANKRARYIERRKEELEEKHPDLVVVSKEYAQEAKAAGALLPNQFEMAKKSDKGAVPAMDQATGTKLWVKPTGAKQPEGPGRKRKDEAGRRAEHERRRAVRTVEKLIAVIENDAEKMPFDKDAQAVLTQYALAFGVMVDMDLSQEERVRAYKSKPYTAAELWEPVMIHMAGDLRGLCKEPNQSADAILDGAALAAWMVDADLKALKAQADEDLPLPVSLGGPGKKREAAADETESDDWDNIEHEDAE